MLRVTLMGNLGADPEVRFSSKGTQIASFRVAVNQVRNGPDGERQENTEWFRVKVSGRQVEYAQRFTKGNRVLVVGRLDIGHYTSRDGEPRTSFDVWADEVQSTSPRSFEPEAMLDGEPESAEPAAAGVSSVARPAAPAARPRASNGRTEASASGAEDLEDLPF